MVRCRPFAHAASTREADLPVKFHAENTPALPANRKGQSGKVLLCPQQDNLATSVAHFCIAVLTRSWWTAARMARAIGPETAASESWKVCNARASPCSLWRSMAGATGGLMPPVIGLWHPPSLALSQIT